MGMRKIFRRLCRRREIPAIASKRKIYLAQEDSAAGSVQKLHRFNEKDG